MRNADTMKGDTSSPRKRDSSSRMRRRIIKKRQTTSKKFSHLLRGGSSQRRSGHVCRFSWPYYPYPTVDSVAQFFQIAEEFIVRLVFTRVDSTFKNYLSPVEVKKNNQTITNQLDIINKLARRRIENPAEAFFETLKFLGHVKLTNLTEKTVIMLPHRPDITEIVLKHDVPIETRVTHMFGGGNVVIIQDERYGTETTHTVLVQKENFEVAPSSAEHLTVSIIVDRKNRQMDIRVRVEWLGPYYKMRAKRLPDEILGEVKCQIINPEREDSKKQKRDEGDRTDDLLAYFEMLKQTKYGPLHQACLEPNHNEYLRKRFEAFLAKSFLSHTLSKNRSELRKRLCHFIRGLHVVNRTPNSVVFLQVSTPDEHVFSPGVGKDVPMRDFIECLYADVYTSTTDEVFNVNMKMVNVKAVDDYLEVKITPRDDVCVVLHVYWLGPQAPTFDSKWYKRILRLENKLNASGSPSQNLGYVPEPLDTNISEREDFNSESRGMKRPSSQKISWFSDADTPESIRESILESASGRKYQDRPRFSAAKVPKPNH